MSDNLRNTSDFNSIRYSNEQPIEFSEQVRVHTAINLIGTGKRVLDIGCWDGSISLLIKNQGNEVYAFENSREGIKKAQQKGIIVKEFNLEEREWPDFGFKFDAVFAGEIIEHVFDTDLFLQNIKGILKPKGILVLTTPNVAALGRRLMLLLGINPYLETTARPHEAGHIRYFTKADLSSLLKENGFHIDTFCSDIVNFTASGKYYSKLIPQIFPALGRSLIVKAININEKML